MLLVSAGDRRQRRTVTAAEGSHVRIDQAKELAERREQLVGMFRKAGEQLGNVVADFCVMHGLPTGADAPPIAPTNAPLLPSRDACKYLGIGQTLLHELRVRGDVKIVKVHSKVLFVRKSLDAYAERLAKASKGPQLNAPVGVARRRKGKAAAGGL